MSRIHITAELVNKINDDMMSKTPKRALVGVERKILCEAFTHGLLPTESRLRELYKEAKAKHVPS